jgi:hypothetical protein
LQSARQTWNLRTEPTIVSDCLSQAKMQAHLIVDEQPCLKGSHDRGDSVIKCMVTKREVDEAALVSLSPFLSLLSQSLGATVEVDILFHGSSVPSHAGLDRIPGRQSQLLHGNGRYKSPFTAMLGFCTEYLVEWLTASRRPWLARERRRPSTPRWNVAWLKNHAVFGRW